jgi:FAD dependent oxidoreductase TIGR03364
LLGGLHSDEELIIDPREAIAALPKYLNEKHRIEFIWHTAVVEVQSGYVITGAGEKHKADLVIVCSGADFETLYPTIFKEQQLTKCKLQMMRMVAQPDGWRIGPALCGGLSLIHYKSFEVAPSLANLKTRYASEYPEYLKWGIHVMVSQNGNGELTIGDSHEYGLTPDPFDRTFINNMILDYLGGFAQFKNASLLESWNGVYPKSTTGATELFLSPDKDVYILNGIGGAGMTLSFGLAEELVNQTFSSY